MTTSQKLAISVVAFCATVVITRHVQQEYDKEAMQVHAAAAPLHINEESDADWSLSPVEQEGAWWEYEANLDQVKLDTPGRHALICHGHHGPQIWVADYVRTDASGQMYDPVTHPGRIYLSGKFDPILHQVRMDRSGGAEVYFKLVKRLWPQ